MSYNYVEDEMVAMIDLHREGVSDDQMVEDNYFRKRVVKFRNVIREDSLNTARMFPEKSNEQLLYMSYVKAIEIGQLKQQIAKQTKQFGLGRCAVVGKKSRAGASDVNLWAMTECELASVTTISLEIRERLKANWVKLRKLLQIKDEYDRVLFARKFIAEINSDQTLQIDSTMITGADLL